MMHARRSRREIDWRLVYEIRCRSKRGERIDWRLVYEIQCRSKRGERIDPEEFDLVRQAHRSDPNRYKSLAPDAHEETRPWRGVGFVSGEIEAEGTA